VYAYIALNSSLDDEKLRSDHQHDSTLFRLTVDIGDNAIPLERAPLLALGSAAREVATTKPLLRDDIEARNKLVAEAGLTEIKTFLGWLIDFRWMTIALPDNKFKIILLQFQRC